jgi:tRNA (guanine37-N1)-methyltransferase
LLDYPHYTRPEAIDGQSVPKVLLSGHQAKIDAWRTEKAEQNTHKKRPDSHII